jgi:hypothetical protein
MLAEKFSKGVVSTLAKGYNGLGVVVMSAKVEQLHKEIESLTSEELRELLGRMADRIELLGWLKVSESAFSDWDNPEDEAYDRL